MRGHPAGYLADMTPQLPLLLAIGFAPAALMLLLAVVTRLESSLPPDGNPNSRA